MTKKQCNECKSFNLQGRFCTTNVQKNDDLTYYMAVTWDDLACHKFLDKNQTGAPSFMDKLRNLANG